MCKLLYIGLNKLHSNIQNKLETFFAIMNLSLHAAFPPTTFIPYVTIIAFCTHLHIYTFLYAMTYYTDQSYSCYTIHHNISIWQCLCLPIVLVNLLLTLSQHCGEYWSILVYVSRTLCLHAILINAALLVALTIPISGVVWVLFCCCGRYILLHDLCIYHDLIVS